MKMIYFDHLEPFKNTNIRHIFFKIPVNRIVDESTEQLNTCQEHEKDTAMSELITTR